MTGDGHKRNDPNPVDMELRDDLRVLQRKFLKHLVTVVQGPPADASEELKAAWRGPSHQELTIIRGVLRDNHMIVPPDDPDAMAAALNRARADLPQFNDDDDAEGAEGDD